MSQGENMKTNMKKSVGLGKKAQVKKSVMSPSQSAFEKFVSKDEYKGAVRSCGKKKAYEIFMRGVKFGKTSK